MNKEYLIKKMRVLIVPYVIGGLIYSGYSVNNLLHIGYGSYYMISNANSLTSLWFLNTMFIALIIVQIIIKLKKHIHIFIAGVGLVVFSVLSPKIELGYPWCFDIACMASTFIIIGYLFEKRIQSIITTGKAIIIFIQGAAMTLLYRINIGAGFQYVLMANRRIGNPSMFFIVAIGGCLMVYGLSRIMENIIKNDKFEKVLTYIGTNTLEIFILHKPIIEFFEIIFRNYSCNWCIQLVITGMGTLSIVFIIGILINCFSPFLFGKDLRK